MAAHQCALPVCPRALPRTMMFCRVHWPLVPRKLQHEVWDAWRAYDAQDGRDLAGYHRTRRAWEDARDRAVVAVARALAKPQIAEASVIA